MLLLHIVLTSSIVCCLLEFLLGTFWLFEKKGIQCLHYTLYQCRQCGIVNSYAPIQFALLHSGDRNPGFYTDHCLKKTTKFKIDLPGYQLMFRLHLVLSSF